MKGNRTGKRSVNTKHTPEFGKGGGSPTSTRGSGLGVGTGSGTGGSSPKKEKSKEKAGEKVEGEVRERPVYSHYTNATDTTTLKIVMIAVCE